MADPSKPEWLQLVQSFISNPWIGFAFGALVVVASYRMNATGANCLIALAWSIFVVSAFRAPPIQQQDLFPRLLWTMLVAAVLGLGFYYILWTSPKKAEANRPHLRGFVTQVISGQPEGGRRTCIVMLLGIINSGPPTTVNGFVAICKSKGREIRLVPNYLPENAEFSFGEGKGSSRIKPSEMIYNKITTNPIPKGGRVDGFVFYIVDGAVPGDFWKEKPVFTIYFYDAAGTEYTVTVQELGPEAPSAVYIPGVNNPFLPFVGGPSPAIPSPTATPSTRTDSDPPFLVTRITGPPMGDNPDPMDSSWWVVYEMENKKLKSPITHLVNIAFTSLRPGPLIIMSYSIEVRAEDGEWKKMTRLPATSGISFFYAVKALKEEKFKKATKLEFDAIFDRIITDNKIQPHDPIRGWIFLEAPKEYVGKERLEWRLRITDINNVEFVRDFTLPPPDREPYEAMGGASLQLKGQEDISESTSVLYSGAHWR